MAVVLGDVIRLPREEEEEEEEEKEAKEGGNASAVVPEADALLGLVVCLFEEEGGNDTGVCNEMLLVLFVVMCFCIYVSWMCC